MIYVGDALFVGGNDYPATEAGVVSIAVRCPNETKCVTEAIIACLDGNQLAWSEWADNRGALLRADEAVS